MTAVDVDSISGPLLIPGDLGSVVAVDECPFTAEEVSKDGSPLPPGVAAGIGSKFC